MVARARLRKGVVGELAEWWKRRQVRVAMASARSACPVAAGACAGSRRRRGVDRRHRPATGCRPRSRQTASVLELAVLMATVLRVRPSRRRHRPSRGRAHGTLVLTVAVTVIEGGADPLDHAADDGKAGLARETVFSVIMVVCNGMVGLCLIWSLALRSGEQGFRRCRRQRLSRRADAAGAPDADPAHLPTGARARSIRRSSSSS